VAQVAAEPFSAARKEKVKAAIGVLVDALFD
jgi:hypothetical protein